MKQRLITAAIGLSLLLVMFFFYDTFIFNLAIAVISFIAVYEALMATKYINNKPLGVICLSFTAIFPFLSHHNIIKFTDSIILLFAFALFVYLIANHQKIKIEQVALSGVIAFMIPASLTSSIYMRNNYGTYIGIFYLLISLGGAWIADAGAYFTGMICGKHKLAPSISPKKTVEGAVGGVISTVISFALIGLIFTAITNNLLGEAYTVNYLPLLLLAPIIAIAGILGDLTASIVKRQCMIKDFGNIMPGHGGVLDRFDSVLFTMPLVYYIAKYLPLIQ